MLNLDTGTAKRVFIYNGHTFTDIDLSFTPEDVRRSLVTHFPKLATAETKEKTLDDGTLEITFVEGVARKG